MSKKDQLKIIRAISEDAEYYSELGYDVRNPDDVLEILNVVSDWEDTSEDYTQTEVKAAIDAKRSKG